MTRAVAVVTVVGEVDMANADELGARLDAALDDAPALVVDLLAVTYLDSQGLRVLARVATRARAGPARLAVVAPDGGVAHQVLGVAGLVDELEVHPTVEAAEAAISPG